MIVGVSWGGSNAIALAKYFKNKYGQDPRMLAFVEAQHRLPGPISSLHGATADIIVNYYSGKKGPGRLIRTGPIAGAFNVDLRGDTFYKNLSQAGDISHVAAEWAAFEMLTKAGIFGGPGDIRAALWDPSCPTECQ